jgi:hypothetical protein
VQQPDFVWEEFSQQLVSLLGSGAQRFVAACLVQFHLTAMQVFHCAIGLSVSHTARRNLSD